ncbi:hypothetical protein H7097_03305 [Aeromicrobium sp.]|nr:hypothetical protein [Candidatus Saccharibacteria bacterium]
MTSKLPQTKFEAEWQRVKREQFEVPGKPKIRPVFFSPDHGIMAALDPFPKFTDQFMVAPATGTPGKRAYFHDLAPTDRQKLHYVADAIGEVLLRRNVDLDLKVEAEPSHRSPVEHIEGHGIPDHPHIVVFGAFRSEGGRLYGHEPYHDSTPVLPDLSSEALDKTALYYSLELRFPEIERGLRALESIRRDL